MLPANTVLRLIFRFPMQMPPQLVTMTASTSFTNRNRRAVRARSREFYVDAAKVKEIRAITGLSQPKFAKLLHVDVGTQRNWEQGRREPSGPTQALLMAIKNNLQAVLKALAP